MPTWPRMFAELHPELRPWARHLYQTAERYGLRPRITSTYRSISTQRRLYNEYRAGRRAFPVAPPGRSLHNFRLAFDMVSDNNDWLGQVWEYWGGRWGGRFRDPIHFDTGTPLP